MTIRFKCPQCGKKLKAAENYAGRMVRCSGCAAVQVVPEPGSEDGTPVRQADQGDADPPVTFPPRAAADDGLDMTPMVDVVFLLLIFFMITAAFALQKSIQMPTPDVSEAASQTRTIEEIEQDDDYVIIRVDKDNTVWVNDVAAVSEHEMLAKLQEARRGPPGTSTPGPSKLLVLASGDARHETVVMALDAGTSAGMEDVRLASAEDDF